MICRERGHTVAIEPMAHWGKYCIIYKCAHRMVKRANYYPTSFIKTTIVCFIRPVIQWAVVSNPYLLLPPVTTGVAKSTQTEILDWMSVQCSVLFYLFFNPSPSFFTCLCFSVNRILFLLWGWVVFVSSAVPPSAISITGYWYRGECFSLSCFAQIWVVIFLRKTMSRWPRE